MISTLQSNLRHSGRKISNEKSSELKFLEHNIDYCYFYLVKCLVMMNLLLFSDAITNNPIFKQNYISVKFSN